MSQPAPSPDDGSWLDEGRWRTATTRRQRISIGLGVGLLAVGVLLTLVTGRSGGPAGLIAIVGFLAGLVGLRYAVRAAMEAPIERRPPAVERRPGVEVTGGDLDASVRAVGSTTEGRAIRARVRVTRRLRDVAARVLAERTSSQEAALDRLESGEWTADERAAALARGDAPADEGWFAAHLGLGARFEDQVAAAVDALEALPRGPDPGDPDEPTPRSLPTGGYWRTGRYRTGRWRGLSGLALLALMTGAIVRAPGPVLTAAVLLGLAGYIRLFDPPPDTVEVTRSIQPAEPAPGERVTVRVVVENVGEVTIPDLRVIDAVPAGLGVVDGSPRLATALGPGAADGFAYDVRASPGNHEFTSVHVERREPSGERALATTTETSTDALACPVQPGAESIPLHPRMTGVTGRVPTAAGGDGVAFHSVRGYRPGDPLSRVDWNRLARTGELTTRALREEHAATVVMMLDVRTVSACTPAAGELSAVDRSRLGAAALLESLLGDGDRVGLATVEAAPSWLRPGGGQAHEDRLAARLRSAGAEADGWAGVDPERYVRRLRRRVPAESQLVCFSPLLDDEMLDILRQLQAHGHAVTLVSPDPTTRAALGARVVRLERDVRLRDLRAGGLRVVDWGHGEALRTAIARARRGWRS